MKILDNLVGTLNEALGEEVGSIDTVEDDEIKAAEIALAEIVERERPLRKRYVVAAITLIVLSVIGVINIVGLLTASLHDAADKTALKSTLAAYVYPVVISDPAGFSESDPPSQSVIISAAIWRILLTEDLSRYAAETDVMYIPESDVEEAAQVLFGDVNLSHKTTGDIEWTFVYESGRKSYRVPRGVRVLTCAPIVRSVASSAAAYEIVVDYVIPAPELPGIIVNTAPVKTMAYTVTRNADGTMSIAAVKYAEQE